MPSATLCHGCDAELPAGHFCPNCGEVMPTYPEPEDPFLKGYHPGRNAMRHLQPVGKGEVE